MAELPKHVHTCVRPAEWSDVKAWDPHPWDCTSPYCNALDRPCPSHGGKHPRLLSDD